MLQKFEELLLDPEWLVLGRSLAIFLVALVFFSILRKIVWAKLTKLTQRTHLKWDDILLEQTKTPVRVFIFFVSLHLAIQLNPSVLKEIPWATPVGKVLGILLGFWLIDRVASTFFRHGPMPAKMEHGTRTFFIIFSRVAIFSVAFLSGLDAVGISITPLLASLGVGSVAVAFALQETLGNFFNGLYLYIDKPIREGDYVKLSDTAQGLVKKIGWRSTRVELLSGNWCIVPNSKIASSEIVNFDFPVSDVDLSITIGVAYESDLDRVEKVCLDEADRVYRTLFKGEPKAPPVVRFKEFGESSIGFSVSMRVPRFNDQFIFRHELMKAIHKRFKQEKIEIPYPHRVVEVRKQDQF